MPMTSRCFLSSGAFNSSMISLFILLIFASSSYCQEDEDYYNECLKPFDCGIVKNLSYPFWELGVRSGICGLRGFGLQCSNGYFPNLTIGNQEFLVKSVNQSGNEMEIAPMELPDDTCPPDYYKNIILNTNLFSYTFNLRFSNISLFYNCSDLLNGPSIQRFPCIVNGEEFNAFYGYDGLGGGWAQETRKCRNKIEISVQKRFLGEGGLGLTLGDVLREGFSIGYKYNESCVSCRNSGGICGTNITNNLGFTCLCHEQAFPVSCPNLNGSKKSVKLKVIIGAMAAVGALLTCGFGFLIHKTIQSLLAPRKNLDFEAFLEKHGPRDVKRYKYSQVKKMTNSFQEKLGKGGYGTVYKGTTPEGLLVAVKMLSSSDEDEEGAQGFLNEVAAISRTSHINIVSLLGFCLDTHKRALVYEFMPNGSLDKFICSENGQHLGWEMLHKIAIGIAQGLEYLHRGCNTRIVHFDIKPHNVLLDENLTPKISDFGLAKLCTRKESKVSMLDARGTIGYIAPEVFCRNFGQVSSKSDVYSYGMMILEMAGGRNKDVEQVEGNNSSEMYFPSWIYRSLELENEGGDISEDNDEFVRKLKLVGLWCIQTNPSDRPAMSKAIEMLQGNVQTLEIPPKPFLSSSPALQFPLYSSTASTVHLESPSSAKASHPLVL